MTIIETFSQNHLAGVIDVILPIQQNEFEIPINIEDQPDLLNIPDFYQKGKGNFWVAIYNSEVIGTISLLDIGNSKAALRKMFVKEKFRGATHKVAEKLLFSLVKWCGINHIEEVFLGTTPMFLAAHRFYEKNGFVEISKDKLPSAFPIMRVDSKFYKIKL